MRLHDAPTFHIQLIESVDALPSSLFVEPSLEDSKGLSRMAILPAALIRGATPKATSRESGWDGLVQAVLSNSCSPLCLDRRARQTQPGESSCCMQKRHAIGDRSERCILTAPGQQTLDLRIAPPRLQREGPSKHRSQARSAKRIRPYCRRLCLLLDAVMIDHNDIDSQLLRQSHGRPRVNAVIDRDKQVGSAAREVMDCW